jgi:hypothetical protein
MPTVNINISSIIGSPDCVSTADGQKVHDEIAASLRAGNIVHLSFKGVKSIITAFLNAAIGQLWGDFKDQELAGKILLVDAKPEDIEKVRRVVTGAKAYFKDKKSFDAAQREAMGTGEND